MLEEQLSNLAAPIEEESALGRSVIVLEKRRLEGVAARQRPPRHLPESCDLLLEAWYFESDRLYSMRFTREGEAL